MTRDSESTPVLTNEELASLIETIDTRFKNTSPSHVLLAPVDWELLKPLLLVGLAAQGRRVTQFDDLARWLEGMHDYARPIDQPKLREAAAIVRTAAEPRATHACVCDGRCLCHCLQGSLGIHDSGCAYMAFSKSSENRGAEP